MFPQPKTAPLALPVGHPTSSSGTMDVGKAVVERALLFRGWQISLKLAVIKYPRNGQKRDQFIRCCTLAIPLVSTYKACQGFSVGLGCAFPSLPLCALLPRVCAHQQLSNVPLMKSKSFTEVSAEPGYKGETAVGYKAGSEASRGGSKAAALHCPHPVSSSPTQT